MLRGQPLSSWLSFRGLANLVNDHPVFTKATSARVERNGTSAGVTASKSSAWWPCTAASLAFRGVQLQELNGGALVDCRDCNPSRAVVCCFMTCRQMFTCSSPAPPEGLTYRHGPQWQSVAGGQLSARSFRDIPPTSTFEARQTTQHARREACGDDGHILRQ